MLKNFDNVANCVKDISLGILAPRKVSFEISREPQFYGT